MKRKLAHIVNPVRVDYTSDLYTAQPITFQSMLLAKEYAKDCIDVELFTAQYPEDKAIIPEGFTQTPDLQRAVADLATFKKYRKLPLVRDILDRLFEATDAEYLVFTNMDITLMPQFYAAINAYLDQGYDALIVNRRRIAAKYTKVEDLPLIFSEIGKDHPGFDCFVFHRELYPKFQLFDVSVALQYTGIGLAYCMWHFARKFKLIDDQHLTIHIGEEVMTPRDTEYYWHSRREFNKTIAALWPKLDIRRFPYSDLSLFSRLWKWAENPNFFVTMCLKLEWRALMVQWRRFRYRLP